MQSKSVPKHDGGSLCLKSFLKIICTPKIQARSERFCDFNIYLYKIADFFRGLNSNKNGLVSKTSDNQNRKIYFIYSLKWDFIWAFSYLCDVVKKEFHWSPFIGAIHKYHHGQHNNFDKLAGKVFSLFVKYIKHGFFSKNTQEFHKSMHVITYG